jgi:hypothetical protein
MKLLFLSLLSVGLTLSTVHASEILDRNDTIGTQCQNGKIVSLLKFNSDILGKNSHIFYDCVSKNIFLNDAKETNAPLEFTYAVDDSQLTLIFYPPVALNKAERSRRIQVVLAEKATATVSEENKVEVNAFDRRQNMSRSFQNFSFLNSLVNVPGWETIDAN